MKSKLTSAVGMIVVLTLITAFFAGPSQALAHSSAPTASLLSSSLAAPQPLSRLDAGLLPAYFGAYGLDVSSLIAGGFSSDSPAIPQAATASGMSQPDNQLNSLALPWRIAGAGAESDGGLAIEGWSMNTPDMASAAYYTPTLKTVGPGSGTVVFTDTLDDPFTVTITFGSWLTRALTLSYAPAESGTLASYAVGYHRFDLGVYVDGVAAPGFELAGYVAMTVKYSNSDVVGLVEDDLTLNYWDAILGDWVDAASICQPAPTYWRYPARNEFLFSPCGFSQYPAAMAGFYGVPTAGMSPLTVVFTNTSLGDVNQYLWNFGDGSTAATENATHTYTLPGVYTVSLTASDGAANSHTLTRTNYISVYTPANANFVGEPASGDRPLTVVFTNTSTGSFSSSSWRFGDGGTSTETNPSHLYAAAGVYTVSLTVSGLGGTSTFTRASYITVNAIPVAADFVGAPTSGTRPLTVVFTNTSTGDYTTSAWDFGDGGTSTAANPSHPYAAAGVYTVTLTVSGPGGSDTETKISYITVNAVPVAANFSGTPTSGVAPLAVTFTNLSSGDYTTSAWTFGDGSTSVVTNPSHSYTTPGVYTVTLTASGPGGSDTETKLSYITVYAPANANFVGAPTSGIRPLSVVFTNTSTGSFSSSSWRFGDGGTSTATNPGHVYPAAGVYTVSLTVSGLGGASTFTRASYITVNAIPVAANFSGTPTSGVAPLAVVFTNTSTGDYTTSAWNFGDGGTSAAANPTHIYAAAGVYTVTLTASGAGGTDTETKVSYVTVYDPVIANFVGTPTSGVRPLSVVFTNTSTGDYTTSAWNFGDGGTSTAANPTHIYAAAGVYTVTLTASGPGGTDTETKVSYITVSYIPVAANFSGTPTSGVAPLAVTFTNLSSGDYTTSAWNFGDGSTITATNPSHSYTTPGVYTVSLTASGPGGSDTETKLSYIRVYTVPVANFVGVPTSGTVPLLVNFTNNSSNYTSSDWDFGDGVTSTTTNPTHTYSVSGGYTVTLTVSGPGGSDTLVRPIYIWANAVPQSVAANFYGAPTAGNIPLTVVFTNTSTGDLTGTLTFPLNSLWNFGDGATSTDRNPIHTYTLPGVYTVSLYVYNALGSDTLTRTSYISASGASGSIDVDPSFGGSVVFTNSTGSTVALLIRDHSVTETVTLVYTEVGTTTTTPSTYLFGNIAFTLDALVGGTPVTDFAFERPIAITLNYNDEDVAGLDENTLRLFYWDEDTGSWVDVINTCTPAGNYLRIPGYNQLTVSMCHLCVIGLFGSERQGDGQGGGTTTYLPILLKE